MHKENRPLSVLLTLLGWLMIFGGVVGVWASTTYETLASHLAMIAAMLVLIAAGVLILRLALRMQPRNENGKE